MLLPTAAENSDEKRFWWFAFHPGERLLTSGEGHVPNRTSTRLLFPLSAEESTQLASQLSSVALSNWQAPVEVGLLGMWPAPSGFCASRHEFDLDGRLRPFPGNTIVCPVTEPDHPYLHCVVAAQSKLRYGFLPPSSFHMTVCELNSSTLSPKASWEECHAAMKERLQPLWTQQQPSFVMQLYDGPVGIVAPTLTTVCLCPHDMATQQALQTFRQQACQRAGFEYDAFYQYHITLAYLLYWPVAGAELRHEMAQVRTQMLHNAEKG